MPGTYNYFHVERKDSTLKMTKKKHDKYLKRVCEYIIICKYWCEYCIPGIEVIYLINYYGYKPFGMFE